MLPAANRMRSSADFTSVVRGGARARATTMVVHQQGLGAGAPLAGLVVGRSVGNSVIRHRVSRRLRAQLAERLSLLPDGSGTVVRALPPAASATSADLGADLDRTLARLARSRQAAPPATVGPSGSRA